MVRKELGGDFAKIVKVLNSRMIFSDVRDISEHVKKSVDYQFIEILFASLGLPYPNGANYQYEYGIQDHLGNTRLTFADLNTNGVVDVPGDILQENHYYPFGMNMNYSWMNNAALDNRYQYNEKELNDDFGLNWNDYGARWYDGAIGRFGSIDGFAEKYLSTSPYSYALGNPISNIDINGDSVWITTTFSADKNGNQVRNDVIHVTGKVLDLSGVKEGGGGCTSAKDGAGSLAKGINQGINSQSTSYKDINGQAVNVSFDAQFSVATSMEDVSESDHLVVIVDEVLGKADPNLSSSGAGGIAPLGGQIGYVENGGEIKNLVRTAIHEIGHNFGLKHRENGSGGYMSYDKDSGGFTKGEIMDIRASAFGTNNLNIGSNREISNASTSNWFFHTSTNESPWKQNTSLAPGAMNMKTLCNNCQGNYAYVCTPQPDNREPAFPAMRNGTLKKITYPTGGHSSFDYEAHTTWGTDSICTENNISQVGLTAGSCTGWNQGGYGVSFTQAQINQGIKLELKWQPYNGSCTYNGSALISIKTCSTCPSIWSASTNGTSYYNLSGVSLVANQTYYIGLINDGGISNFKFYNLSRSAVQSNKIVGGLRIKTITTNDGDATTTNNIVKNYEYADPVIPARTSGKLVHKPLYVGLYIVPCTTVGGPGCVTDPDACDYPATNENIYISCPSSCGVLPELHAIYAHSSLQPMQTTLGSHIGYTAVQVKETGNGKSEYRYNMGQYASGPWVPTGYPFPPPPYDPQLGTLASEGHYDQSGLLLSATTYSYLTATNPVITMTGRHANKVSLVPSAITSRFYNINTGYSLLQQTAQQQYNTNGTFVEKVTDIGYTVSNGHLQKTTQDVIDSDNTVYRTKYKYAKDYPCPSSGACDETNGTANAEGKAIYAMRKRNMVAIPIEQTNWLKRPSWGTTFKLTGATYFQFDKVNTSYDNLKLKTVYQVRPASASTSFTESTTSTSGTFTKNGAYIQEYNFVFSDTHGKILSQWKQNDPAKQQYIWGYNQKIPTAKVINAETTEIAYTSFEEQLNTPAGNGNWTLTGVGGGWSNTSGEFQTGRTGYNLTPAPRACTASGVPAGKYVVSFWHKNGSVFVNGASVSTASSTWKYGETVLTFTNLSNTVTVSSGSGDWGQFIDELRLYPSDALMRSFSYNDRSQLLLSVADENSVPAHYDYDNFQRLQAVRDQDRNIVQTYEYNYQQAGAALNDNKARTVLTSGQTTVSAVNALTGPDVRRVFQYMDGLGRPVQTNAIGQSPTAKDIISINQYDQYGREPKQYIPYTFTTNSGAYRSAALTEQAAFGTTYGAGTIAFAQSVFEPSPLNRVTEQGAPGTTWQTGQGVNAHTIRSAWKGNLATEAIRDFTNGNSFGDNKLWRTETKDENGRFQYTYTDKLGRTVMVRQQLPLNLAGQEDTTYARTYTVYDDFGRVVAVIPPEAAKKMKAAINWDYTSATYSSMVYLYTYDSRGRLISKSVPSGGTTTIAYDRLDRPVLSTDANGFKIFTRYDILSRPVVSGRYKGSSSPGGSDPLFETPNTTAPHFYTTAAFPTDNNLDVYKVLYYDDYDIDNNGSLGATETYTNPAEAGYETAAFLRTRGKPTAAKTAILKNDNSAPTTYLTTRTYFDKEYSVIQVSKQNHLGGSDVSSSVYDFANRITKTRRDHTATPPGGTLKTYTIREEYIYDEAGRVRFTRHNALTGTGTPPAGSWVVTSAPIYDELNRMIDKRLHASNYDGTSSVTLSSTFNYLQSVDYSYNIRGWLTGMNDVTTCTTQSGDNLGDMFKMSLTYESTATGGAAQYNGNISTMQWSTSVNTTTCSNRSLYRFSYDAANRLTAAAYLIWTGGWNAVNYYTESGVKYDMNGNLKSYTRQGLTSSGPNTFGLIDQLTYTYGDALRPDRLTQMADAGSITKGFKPGSGLTGDHYLYDANGNMTQDKHKGFVVAYNHLNLPITFTKSTNVITMTYTADGEKLTKAITGGGATKNYVGGIEYSGANLEAIYHGEGRLTPNGSNFFYEYTLKDHLGNARINFRANGAGVTFLEEQHYYPFGMRMEGIGATVVTDNPYEYNGKEFNDDFSLGLSDYGARWYDAAVGRWWSVDPLGEKYERWSTYNFNLNNPIVNIDMNGDSVRVGQGILNNEELNSAFNAFASTEEGFGFLSMFAAKGQEIGGKKVKKDGEMHVLGVDLNYDAYDFGDVSSKGTTEEVTDYKGVESGPDINVNINLGKNSSISKLNGNEKKYAFSQTVIHESFIHVLLSAQDWKDNKRFDSSNIPSKIKDNKLIYKNHWQHRYVVEEYINFGKGYYAKQGLNALNTINQQLKTNYSIEKIIENMWNFNGGIPKKE